VSFFAGGWRDKNQRRTWPPFSPFFFIEKGEYHDHFFFPLAERVGSSLSRVGVADAVLWAVERVVVFSSHPLFF